MASGIKPRYSLQVFTDDKFRHLEDCQFFNSASFSNLTVITVKY